MHYAKTTDNIQTKNPNKDEYKNDDNIDKIQDSKSNNEERHIVKSTPEASSAETGGGVVINLAKNVKSDKIELLRSLLLAERKKHDLRRQNNKTLRAFLDKLQADYLKLQQELVDALDLGHKMKARKDAQLESVNETIKEKELIITSLRDQLAQLDSSNLKTEYELLAKKQNQLYESEREALKKQLETLEQQIINERRNNSQLLQEFQSKYEEKCLVSDKEIEKLKSKLESNELEIQKLLELPSNETLRQLRSEKNSFVNQLDECKQCLESCQSKYEVMKRRLETLVVENDQNEEKNYQELQRLQVLYSEQRRQVGEISLKLQDKEEALEMLQFSLKRSEQRTKYLLTALRGKEETYESLISSIKDEINHQVEELNEQLQKSKQELIRKQGELDDKANELERMKLECKNELSLLITDKDERLRVLETKLSLAEQKLAQKDMALSNQLRQSTHDCEQIEQLTLKLQSMESKSNLLSKKTRELELDLSKRDESIRELNKKMTDFEKVNLTTLDSEYQIDLFKSRESRLQQAFDEVTKENEKLNVKLKFSENKLIKLNDSFRNEQTKLIKEYETKLSTYKLQKFNNERNVFKYKKYATKLKRYCEHLRQVHDHICNPNKCGYLITNKSDVCANGDKQTSILFEKNLNTSSSHTITSVGPITTTTVSSATIQSS